MADLARVRSELELALDSYDIERDGEARGKYAQETPATARAWMIHKNYNDPRGAGRRPAIPLARYVRHFRSRRSKSSAENLRAA
jgi:hypothetical protein